MRTREMSGWLKAIDKCLKQKEYGDTRKCSLCLHVHTDCERCIVLEYWDDKYVVQSQQGISSSSGSYPCVKFFNFIGEDDNFLVRANRKHLRLMKQWLEKLYLQRIK